MRTSDCVRPMNGERDREEEGERERDREEGRERRRKGRWGSEGGRERE